jgi:hypothetical protein
MEIDNISGEMRQFFFFLSETDMISDEVLSKTFLVFLYL